METINPNCSDPAISNSYIVYEDVIGGEGTYGSGNGSRYVINTKIRARLFIHAEAMYISGGSIQKVFQAPWNYTVNDDSTYSVTINVPDGCYVYYKIVGYVNFESLLPSRDYREEPTGIVMSLSQIHNHDGINSPRIDASNITNIRAAYAITLTFKFSGGGYSYDLNFDDDGANVLGVNNYQIKLTSILHNINDGLGNYNVDQVSLVATVGGDTVNPTERWTMRFWDPGTGDVLDINRDGVLYMRLDGLDGPVVPHPSSGITTYTLIFTATPI